MNEHKADPMREHMPFVDEPTPEQLAGVLCAVAGAADRQNWTVEQASDMLDALGLGPVEISLARRALRASLRVQRARAQMPAPIVPASEPVLRSVPALPAPVPEVVPEVSPTPVSIRDAKGHFVPTGLCQKLLHPLTGDNVVTRPDRPSRQCRACTQTRKSLERARKRAHRLAQRGGGIPDPGRSASRGATADVGARNGHPGAGSAGVGE